MLIQTTDLRDRFGISKDAPEAKLTNAIWEAENIDMRECFGKEIVAKFNTDSEFRDKYMDETDDHGGLRAALCYLAYSRYMEVADIQNTAAGSRIADALLSKEVNYKDKNNVIQNNRDKGHALLHQIKALICDEENLKKSCSKRFNFHF